LTDFMKNIDTDVIGEKYGEGKSNGVNNEELIFVNENIQSHLIEEIGYELRTSMTEMKRIVS